MEHWSPPGPPTPAPDIPMLANAAAGSIFGKAPSSPIKSLGGDPQHWIWKNNALLNNEIGRRKFMAGPHILLKSYILLLIFRIITKKCYKISLSIHTLIISSEIRSNRFRLVSSLSVGVSEAYSSHISFMYPYWLLYLSKSSPEILDLLSASHSGY